jgi:hypothetical protein
MFWDWKFPEVRIRAVDRRKAAEIPSSTAVTIAASQAQSMQLTARKRERIEGAQEDGIHRKLQGSTQEINPGT